MLTCFLVERPFQSRESEGKGTWVEQARKQSQEIGNCTGHPCTTSLEEPQLIGSGGPPRPVHGASLNRLRRDTVFWAIPSEGGQERKFSCLNFSILHLSLVQVCSGEY